MSKCQFQSCTNDAEKVLGRPTTDEEQNMRRTDSGALKWEFQVKTQVCNEHLAEAQKEYPYVVNEEP
ncbi:MAG TPA: hypothetical protein VMS31_22645 [Pyrinomonadaceae bacterium]|nr:hypothetical protein [Pyrinomonadaceae bacterium]